MSLEVKIGLAILYTIIALLPILVFFFIKKKKMKLLSRQNPDNGAMNAIPPPDQTDFGTEAVYHKISPEETKELLDYSKNVVLVDVRSTEEYVQERIAGSILIPDYEIEEQAPIRIPEKNTRIIVYCLSGVRSQRAAKLLVSLHYTNVFDMGSMMSWPFETVHG